MDELPVARHRWVHLTPDPARVITKPFIPHEEIYPDGSSRIQVVLDRIAAMTERTVVDTLHAARASFAARHRDLDDTLESNFEGVTERLHPELVRNGLSPQRRL